MKSKQNSTFINLILHCVAKEKSQAVNSSVHLSVSNLMSQWLGTGHNYTGKPTENVDTISLTQFVTYPILFLESLGIFYSFLSYKRTL